MPNGTTLPPVSLWRNNVSFLGAAVFVFTAAATIALFIIDVLSPSPSPYLGFLVFLVLPAFPLVGIALFILGIWLERKKHRPDEPLVYIPGVELGTRLQKIRFTVYLLVGALLVVIPTVVLYEAYHFTESVAFCGDVCHKVMEPERVLYQKSPHARVTCAECHVGAGANWYVKSKLSGVRQIFATIFGTFHTPIPTPVEQLRPARETCEECHWPSKFYGAKMFVSSRYAYDERNTPRTLSMLVLIGGEGGGRGGGAGIHWHMLLDNKVSFQAADRTQQVIPLVWVERRDGSRVEYRLQGYLEKEEGKVRKGEQEVRVMDCVTCHNRPTHIYRSPEYNVDTELLNGRIDATLPFVKRKAVEALVAGYPDAVSARQGIEKALTEYYRKEHPAVVSAQAEAMGQAVKAVQRVYSTSFFPAMKADWRAYPDNIGHRDFPGCFRCHDGKHTDPEGKVITRECSACHTVPALGPMKAWTSGYPVEKESWHPFELKGRHATMDCGRCHDGGLPKASDCAGCHGHPQDAPMADMKCADCHQAEQELKPIEDCTVCHDEIRGLHRQVADHKAEPCTACHRPHGWTPDARATCLACHDDMKDHHAGARCDSCHSFRK